MVSGYQIPHGWKAADVRSRVESSLICVNYPCGDLAIPVRAAIPLTQIAATTVHYGLIPSNYIHGKPIVGQGQKDKCQRLIDLFRHECRYN